MVAVIAGIASKQGRLTSREGVFPRHCGVLARVEAMPHRSTPLLLLLPALPAIVLLLAIAAHRASQLRMRTSACSSQTLTGLRTFNPKVVGSSPTGGTNHGLSPGRSRGLTRARDVGRRNPALSTAAGVEVSNPHPEYLSNHSQIARSPAHLATQTTGHALAGHTKECPKVRPGDPEGEQVLLHRESDCGIEALEGR